MNEKNVVSQPHSASASTQAELDHSPDALLLPATVNGNHKVAFIGPFGPRVSFASQQRRALNVVWALSQKSIVKEGASIAVVGGGVAGITAAVACKYFRCQVTVFEKEKDVLLRQEAARHRFLHPTINFWPREVLNPSTHFPFFDWLEGDCNAVVGAMRAEWDKNFKGMMRCRYGSDVKEVNGTSLTYQFRSAGAKISEVTEDFCAVIVCTGFGEEAEFPSAYSKSYWVPDYLEYPAKEADKNNNYFISGTGDGGIIDLLRVLHRDFEKGRFCVKIAKCLEADGLSGEILKIEKDLNGINSSVGSGGSLEKYTSLMPSLSDGTREVLHRSYLNHNFGKVKVISRSLDVSAHAAPIHKFLFAHAHHVRAFDLIKAKVVSRGESVFAELDEPIGEDREIKLSGIVILRHGPEKHPLEAFILDVLDREDLTKRQKQNANIFNIGDVKSAFAGGIQGYPKWNSSDRYFVSSRYEQVSKYFSENFMWQIGVVSDDAEQGNWRFEARRLPASKYESSSLPRSIFGIDVDPVGPIPNVVALGVRS